jgi:hypothetical protein
MRKASRNGFVQTFFVYVVFLFVRVLGKQDEDDAKRRVAQRERDDQKRRKEQELAEARKLVQRNNVEKRSHQEVRTHQEPRPSFGVQPKNAAASAGGGGGMATLGQLSPSKGGAAGGSALGGGSAPAREALRPKMEVTQKREKMNVLKLKVCSVG